MFSFPPPIPDNSCIYKIQCQHLPIYLGGRYNKYTRELPQTPWVVDGERKMDSSVNELITDIVEKWIMCDSKFKALHSCLIETSLLESIT